MGHARLRVLGHQTSANTQKVLWLLEELNVDYQREDYGRRFGNTATEAYLRLNPNGKVPTLLDGSVTIWESNTILRYLASKQETSLYPRDAVKRTDVERWMDWQLCSLFAPYLKIFLASRADPPVAAGTLIESVQELISQLSILEHQIAEHSWITGNDLTLADICLGPIIYRCVRFDIELPDLPHVNRWSAAMAEREQFRKAIGIA